MQISPQYFFLIYCFVLPIMLIPLYLLNMGPYFQQTECITNNQTKLVDVATQRCIGDNVNITTVVSCIKMTNTGQCYVWLDYPIWFNQTHDYNKENNESKIFLSVFLVNLWTAIVLACCMFYNKCNFFVYDSNNV